jgi:hypothetical protein
MISKFLNGRKCTIKSCHNFSFFSKVSTVITNINCGAVCKFHRLIPGKLFLLPTDGLVVEWTEAGEPKPPLSKQLLDEHRPWLLRRYSHRRDSAALSVRRVTTVALGDRCHADGWRDNGLWYWIPPRAKHPPAPHKAFGGQQFFMH